MSCECHDSEQDHNDWQAAEMRYWAAYFGNAVKDAVASERFYREEGIDTSDMDALEVEVMSEHTLGPWTVEDVFGDGLLDICLDYQIEGAGVPILLASTYTDGDGYPISDGQALANARLIAAAPELLAALKEMAEWHGGSHDGACPADDTCDCSQKPFNDRVNGAINKAEGRP